MSLLYIDIKCYNSIDGLDGGEEAQTEETGPGLEEDSPEPNGTGEGQVELIAGLAVQDAVLVQDDLGRKGTHPTPGGFPLQGQPIV